MVQITSGDIDRFVPLCDDTTYVPLSQGAGVPDIGQVIRSSALDVIQVPDDFTAGSMSRALSQSRNNSQPVPDITVLLIDVHAKDPDARYRNIINGLWEAVHMFTHTAVLLIPMVGYVGTFALPPARPYFDYTCDPRATHAKLKVIQDILLSVAAGRNVFPARQLSNIWMRFPNVAGTCRILKETKMDEKKCDEKKAALTRSPTPSCSMAPVACEVTDEKTSTAPTLHLSQWLVSVQLDITEFYFHSYKFTRAPLKIDAILDDRLWITCQAGSVNDFSPADFKKLAPFIRGVDFSHDREWKLPGTFDLSLCSHLMSMWMVERDSMIDFDEVIWPREDHPLLKLQLPRLPATFGTSRFTANVRDLSIFTSDAAQVEALQARVWTGLEKLTIIGPSENPCLLTLTNLPALRLLFLSRQAVVRMTNGATPGLTYTGAVSLSARCRFLIDEGAVRPCPHTLAICITSQDDIDAANDLLTGTRRSDKELLLSGSSVEQLVIQASMDHNEKIHLIGRSERHSHSRSTGADAPIACAPTISRVACDEKSSGLMSLTLQHGKFELSGTFDNLLQIYGEGPHLACAVMPGFRAPMLYPGFWNRKEK